MKDNKFVKVALVIVMILLGTDIGIRVFYHPSSSEKRSQQGVSETKALPKASKMIYRNNRSEQDSLELNPDGTFYLQQMRMGRKQAVTGKYKIEGNVITFTLESGEAARGAYQGDRIIDDENTMWVKK